MYTYLHIVLGARYARMGDRGASAVEYALLVAGVAVIIMIGTQTLGHGLMTVFDQENSKMTTTPGTGN